MQVTSVPALAFAWHSRLLRWSLLALATLAPRLALLAHYNVELSEDGYSAVSTLRVIQEQGLAAVPLDLIDRFLLHPLYMLLLSALRILTPSSADFFLAARLVSVISACAVAILIFELSRRAFDELAAWLAVLLLMFVPTALYEGISILSSTLFLALYVAVLLALLKGRYRLAALLAFLAAITRYEGAVLVALVCLLLLHRDLKQRRLHQRDWLVTLALAGAFPLTLILVGVLTSGNPLGAIAANSMAAVWLRTLAPAEFSRRALFFLTGYPRLLPDLLVWIALAGALIVVIWHRQRATGMLLLASALYVVFYETLVWFDLTTLEERFLIYSALPFLIFGAAGLADAWRFLAHAAPPTPRRIPTAAKSLRPESPAETAPPAYPARPMPGQERSPLRRLPTSWPRSALAGLALVTVLAVILVQCYRRADAGMQWLYNNHASQSEVVDHLLRFILPDQPTRITIYAGFAGPLDFFARQRHLDLVFNFFRFIPPDHPEQYLLDLGVQYVLYPVDNPFAKAKYPYLDHLEQQTHGPVTFVPLAQFTTTLNGQLYTLWSVSRSP